MQSVRDLSGGGEVCDAVRAYVEDVRDRLSQEVLSALVRELVLVHVARVALACKYVLGVVGGFGFRE